MSSLDPRHINQCTTRRCMKSAVIWALWQATFLLPVILWAHWSTSPHRDGLNHGSWDPRTTSPIQSPIRLQLHEWRWLRAAAELHSWAQSPQPTCGWADKMADALGFGVLCRTVSQYKVQSRTVSTAEIKRRMNISPVMSKPFLHSVCWSPTTG